MIEGREIKAKGTTLSYGMVGGGVGSFIGDVHRKAAAFDGKAQIVAGCFSQDFAKTLQTGEQLGIDQDRLYPNFEEMAKKESQRPDGISFAVIVTPNYAHYQAAKAFLTRGIHVVCDKPLTFTVEQAEELADIAKQKDLLFCVTYAYSRCTAVRQAKEMVSRGDIGEIKVVMGEYPQGWLATKLEETGQKQALWRTDPAMAGISNCLGDIGTHIENTVSYITGLEIAEVCAKLSIIGPGRNLDTDAHVLLKYTNGAVGNYWASQVAIGHDNGLRIRIYGTKGSLEWAVERPDELKVAMINSPIQIMTRGNGYLYPEANALSRIPAGHPEGYFESFANTYLEFLTALSKKVNGEDLSAEDLLYPDVYEGVRGVKFVHHCVNSSKQGSIWIPFT